VNVNDVQRINVNEYGEFERSYGVVGTLTVVFAGSVSVEAGAVDSYSSFVSSGEDSRRSRRISLILILPVVFG